MFKLFKEDSDSVLLTRRNAAIDVFRGLVMLLMVFVNDFYIRGVAVDGHSTTKSAFDDVISVVKIVEFDTSEKSFFVCSILQSLFIFLLLKF